jgi:hypothetical protein
MPDLAYYDNTTEPLCGALGPGSGSNIATDHLTAPQSAFRQRPVVTCDGAGANRDLIALLDTLAARSGYQVISSVVWEVGKLEKARSPPSRRRLPDRRRWSTAKSGNVVSPAPVSPGANHRD